MTKERFINMHIRNGIWEGELARDSEDAPVITVSHQGTGLDGVTCTWDAARAVWQIRAPIPLAMINDGLQTFIVSDGSGTVIASFSLLAGEALADDLRAEIDLLRSELDLLKKAFRKHCAES